MFARMDDASGNDRLNRRYCVEILKLNPEKKMACFFGLKEQAIFVILWNTCFTVRRIRDCKRNSFWDLFYAEKTKMEKYTDQFNRCTFLPQIGWKCNLKEINNENFFKIY